MMGVASASDEPGLKINSLKKTVTISVNPAYSLREFLWA